ncbi:ATP-binding protein [Treponema sp. OMZ 788]|uniref:ATP-binding protein n=1 Tax=Treponema sp. OMZ 788 TaxID=2563664 RepID=UPI0020A392A1|nr:ATP-binding protein [Treponema sp. OMZ 788]UTC64836.1 ATP-binding protein [Treponema sp. OMZ 788]
MTEVKRSLPIGVQSFEKLIEADFLYIDKTKYIWDLINNKTPYFLSRPRRFGKSLFLSTLKAYFLGQKELFKGLALEKLEESEKDKREIWQEYPVLYLDFNTAVYESREDLINILSSFLAQYEAVYGSTGLDITDRFKKLIRAAHEKTGRQVVILIDEYDKPLLSSMENLSLNETYRTILKGFYGVIKSSDASLRFAFLTGVTKFSKVSIFSDLNNLRDISMLPDFSAICGITEKELKSSFQSEIKALAEANHLSEEDAFLRLKQKYDGYCFSERGTSVYNPFSLLNVFAGKVFRDFWYATGTPTFLVKYLKEGHYYIPELDGDIQIDEYGLNAYRADPILPIPILFQAGYLTIKDYDKEYGLYRLGFPNDEVRYGFLHNLMPAFTPIGAEKTGVSVMEFTKAVKAGDIDAFMKKMQALISGIPYDNLAEKDLALREQNYQAAVYLIFALMNQFVQTEIHCATGRADCIVHTQDRIYIFEFKLEGRGTAEDAIKQIKEKNYAAPYKEASSGGIKKTILAVGASFDEEKRTIKDWRTEELV